ncbi:MAG: alpha/beta hydrolase [Pseudomonadota bacterium]
MLRLGVLVAGFFALSFGANADPSASDPFGRYVSSFDGVQIFATEAGPRDGPSFLFIHGLSQSHAAWSLQYDSAFAQDKHVVAMDLRGHGNSEKTYDVKSYQDSRTMAEDVSAVIKAFGLKRPILVGWSYGAIIVGDYLAFYGDNNLSGVVLVSGALHTNISEEFFGAGALHLYGMLSDELSTQFEASLAFVENMPADKVSPDEVKSLFRASLMTPPYVRRAIAGRTADHRNVLDRLTAPLMVIHGAKDPVLTSDLARHTAGLKHDTVLKIYDGVGHAPFLEASERFNADLSAFAAR